MTSAPVDTPVQSITLVLDASAFDHLDRPTGSALRALLERALLRGGTVRAAAVTLAEVCRGAERTRRTEAALARSRTGGQRILMVATDERLAKSVGAILYASGRGSADLADAHVVAVAAASGAETAIVITADPDDIRSLADTLPGVRILTRPAQG